jgi:galactitol-specific phosphotransferase system IIC component
LELEVGIKVELDNKDDSGIFGDGVVLLVLLGKCNGFFSSSELITFFIIGFRVVAVVVVLPEYLVPRR